MRPADLKYYTKTRDFTDVYVVGGKTAYQKPKVAAEYPYTSAHAHKFVNSVRSNCQTCAVKWCNTASFCASRPDMLQPDTPASADRVRECRRTARGTP